MKLSTWKEGRTWFAGVSSLGVVATGSTREIAVRSCHQEIIAEQSEQRRLDEDEREIDRSSAA